MRRNYKSCDLVADFFLLHLDINAGDSITNLKMQKLCYYAQAWSLALRDRPMFDCVIRAWAHGPAIPELYHRFKHYGWGCIDPHDLRSEPLNVLSTEDVDHLEAIWLRYGNLSGKDLERLTHSESPWRDAYGDTPIGEKCTAEISHDSMKNFYRQKLTFNYDADTRTSSANPYMRSENRSN